MFAKNAFSNLLNSAPSHPLNDFIIPVIGHGDRNQNGKMDKVFLIYKYAGTQENGTIGSIKYIRAPLRYHFLTERSRF